MRITTSIIILTLLSLISNYAYAEDIEDRRNKKSSPVIKGTIIPTGSLPNKNEIQQVENASTSPSPQTQKYTDKNLPLPALKLLTSQAEIPFSIGITHSGMHHGIGNLSISGYGNPILFPPYNWAMEYNLAYVTEPYMTTGIQSFTNIEFIYVYHHTFNQIFGLYGGAGLRYTGASYTLNNWRTSQANDSILSAYTIGMEMALSPNIYLKAGYRDDNIELGIEEMGLSFPSLPAISLNLPQNASSVPALAINNKDIRFPPYGTMGLTYSTLYDGNPNVNFNFYLKDSPNLIVEGNVGMKTYNYPTGEDSIGISDFMLVYHQAINNTFGYYGGAGIEYVSSSFKPNNTAAINYPATTSSLTIAYTIGLELALAKPWYLKAGYRDGGFETGLVFVY